MPRVLILGKRGGILKWPEHLLDARDLELDIQLFALNHQGVADRTLRKLIRLLGKTKLEAFVANELAKRIHAFQPSLILIVDLHYLSSAVVNVLNSYSGNMPIAQWIGDKFEPRLLNNARVVDHFFFTTSSLVAEGKALDLPNCHFLPLAYNPKIFYPGDISWEQRDRKPLFIGAYSPNREAFFRTITTPMAIYGKGWKPHLLPQHACHDRNISISKVAELYRQHAIVLNMINSNNISSGLNMRCFEAPGSGCLLVTEDTPDLWECFKQGEILAYDTPETGLHSILSSGDTTALSEVSLRGLERVNADHQYSSRLRRILSIGRP